MTLLLKLTAHYGISEKMITDNGPQFEPNCMKILLSSGDSSISPVPNIIAKATAKPSQQ